MVFKFRDLPARIHPFIAQTFERALQGAGHSRDHGVLGRTRFQHFQHWPVAEAGIGPHAKLPNVGRDGEKTTGQEFVAASPGSRIAAPQFDIPEERGVRFQTQQWVIGSFASIARIVANRRAFLMAKDSDDGAIQIQNQSRPVIRPVNELFSSRSLARCSCSRNEQGRATEIAVSCGSGKLGRPVKY